MIRQNVQARVVSFHPGLVNVHDPPLRCPACDRRSRACSRNWRRQSGSFGLLRDLRCELLPSRTVLMVLRGGEPTAAMDYLRGACRGEDRAAVVSAAVEEKLRSWWRESSCATKRLHINVEGADAKKKWAVAKARRFLAECNLDIWVARQNLRKGITPMSSLVLEKGKHELRIAGIAAARTRKAGLQWLRRWRRRCGVRLKKLPALDTLGGGDCAEG